MFNSWEGKFVKKLKVSDIYSYGCHKYVYWTIRGLLVEQFEEGYSGIVDKCPNWKQVKAKHWRSRGLTQPMDIEVCFAQTQRKNNSICVMVEKLTKWPFFPW